MSKKIDWYDFSEIDAALLDDDDEALALLKACAKRTGFPATGWTASPALTLLARIWATMNVARGLEGQVIDPNDSQRRYTWNAALDAAEASLFKEGHEPEGRPKSVRTTLARWRRDVRDP